MPFQVFLYLLDCIEYHRAIRCVTDNLPWVKLRLLQILLKHWLGALGPNRPLKLVPYPFDLLRVLDHISLEVLNIERGRVRKHFRLLDQF